VVVVDMRWREDGSGRRLYDEGHIEGAAFLDWTTDIVDPTNPVAFSLAPPERFARAMEARGISDGDVVVAYADQGGSGPFRLWWACREYGHDDVRILDGGFERWVREERPVSSDRPSIRTARWTPRPRRDRVAGADDVQDAAANPRRRVLDSRPPEHHAGQAVWFETGPVPVDADGVARTPRGDIRGGRVPWAGNVPAASLYREDRTMRPPEELRDLFAAAGVEPGHEVITYCGVGLSASALLYALHRAGYEDTRLYDASWEEWGRDLQRPVARD
jgi:thiosulfate/3-mercaptopyruvate sulfurtransferase